MTGGWRRRWRLWRLKAAAVTGRARHSSPKASCCGPTSVPQLPTRTPTAGRTCAQPEAELRVALDSLRAAQSAAVDSETRAESRGGVAPGGDADAAGVFTYEYSERMSYAQRVHELAAEMEELSSSTHGPRSRVPTVRPMPSPLCAVRWRKRSGSTRRRPQRRDASGRRLSEGGGHAATARRDTRGAAARSDRTQIKVAYVSVCDL